MVRVNIDILGIREQKWTGMGEFNSDDILLLLWARIPWRNGVAIILSKRVQNTVLGCNLKNNRMISVHFQGKPLSITVIQVYAPTSNAEESEVEWFHEELQGLLELTHKELTHKKRCPLHYRELEWKNGMSRATWSNRQIWPWSTEWSMAKANSFAKRMHWS